MADLCSIDDVADLLALESTGLDADQAAALLAQASARFRAEARCDFDETDSTMVLRVVGQRVTLPRRPVTAVDSVSSLLTDGSVGAAISDWAFDGIDTIRIGDQAIVINASWSEQETVSVTWSHGWAAVPEDVRWAVAQMVARAISSPAPAGVSGETIGAYSYRTGATSASGGLGMTDEERAIAHRYRPRSSTLTSVIT